jgi:pimeloyl-ACP methyl ester carboxylesterase
MTPRTLALPGVDLHLEETGEGDPLVLLHGWPQHGGMWAPLIDDLARTHRVLVPDLRGFGRSQAPVGDYAKHTLAGDILALLDAEEIDRAAIVGHDWGGWIAWLLALEHPERVERFAALDIPPPFTSPSLARLPLQLIFGSYQFAVASPVLGRRLVGSPRVMRRFLSAGARQPFDDEAVDDYARRTAQPGSAEASVSMYRTFLTREVPALIRGTYTSSNLEVPGLVVMGGESAIKRMTGIPPEMPCLRVEVLPGVGHFLVDEAPDEVLALLRPFLAERSN